MNEVLMIIGGCCAASCVNTAWRYLTVDVYLNVAQAAVDASRCMMILEQIDNPPLDVELVDGSPEFDLPFMDLTTQPNWWYEIWLFDFLGRQIVMTHAAENMEVQWPEFDTAEF